MFQIDFIEKAVQFIMVLSRIIIGLYVKDCSILAGRKQSNIILIDNMLQNLAVHLKNGIPIKSFIDEKDDTELLFIKNRLKKVTGNTNVPEFLKKEFKLSAFYNFLNK